MIGHIFLPFKIKIKELSMCNPMAIEIVNRSRENAITSSEVKKIDLWLSEPIINHLSYLTMLLQWKAFKF